MKEVLVALFCLLLPALVLVRPIRRGKGTLRERLTGFRYEWAVYVVLAVGFAVRMMALGEYPTGFNQDEASAAYDAFALMTTGRDRHGEFLPVYFIAWGSGQSVLYSYLSIPFMAVFGTTVWAFRLPMALVGCLSLFVFWRLLLYMTDKKTALAGLALLAVCPWHILKSRWGLDCNLFPDLVLLGILLLISGLKRKRTAPFLAGCGVLGLSAYAYATSYLFLPLLVLPLLAYLVAKKQTTLLKAAAGLGILMVVALPMILFALINTFELPAIRLPFMTIPRLTANRMSAMASVFSADFLRQSAENFAEAAKVTVTQSDGLIWNAMDGFGIVYVFSLPFTVIGLLHCLAGRKERRPAFGCVMNAWLLAALVLVFVVRPNINRINALWLPLVYYTALGAAEVARSRRLFRTAVAGLYMTAFLLFEVQYFTTYQEKMKTAFEDSFGEAVSYAAASQAETIYVTQQVNGAYALTLFYTRQDPQEFQDTVKIVNPGAMFEQVAAYGRYRFETPQTLPEGTAAVVRNETADRAAYQNYRQTRFERFTVLENPG